MPTLWWFYENRAAHRVPDHVIGIHVFECHVVQGDSDRGELNIAHHLFLVTYSLI
jgi:hypothetical protein